MNGETRRCEGVQAAGTAFDIEDALASLAAEMVMVPEIRPFVVSNGARQGDRLEPALFHERLQRAIDGRDADVRHGGVHFVRMQRPGLAFEHSADRGALTGVARPVSGG